ncbi:MAG: hypothetical protein B7Z70_15115 [Acidithiobacillus ferrivorans]|uniref:Phosphoserine phosphatase n=1 Tax=Acidithiobacillus ferrivorans TaxID=160808 RepID=A0A257SGJ6_9PROT|nr:MAG: hypothetical protein B7Z70_15115 [Acidithiobacillus ferrivorans]
MSKKLIPIAIAYDFDGTLAPGNMQEYDFIPALNMMSKEFWKSVNEIAQQHEMDQILAYMWAMLRQADKADIRVHKSDFKNFGKNITLFPGVSDWFKRINAYARSKGVRLQHFIISSGIREMVEGSPGVGPGVAALAADLAGRDGAHQLGPLGQLQRSQGSGQGEGARQCLRH